MWPCIQCHSTVITSSLLDFSALDEEPLSRSLRERRSLSSSDEWRRRLSKRLGLGCRLVLWREVLRRLLEPRESSTSTFFFRLNQKFISKDDILQTNFFRVGIWKTDF